MSKKFKVIFSFFIAALIILSLSFSSFAADDLTVTTDGKEKDVTIYTDLDTENPNFFYKGLVNPGDSFDLSIHVVNKSKKSLQVSFHEISNLAKGIKKSDALLKFLKLKLVLVRDGKEVLLFDDKIENIFSQKPIISWTTLKSNEFYDIKVTLECLPEADNSVQLAPFDTKWLFIVRDADIIKTGVLSPFSNIINSVWFWFVLIVLILACVLLIYELKHFGKVKKNSKVISLD